MALFLWSIKNVRNIYFDLYFRERERRRKREKFVLEQRLWSSFQLSEANPKVVVSFIFFLLQF